MPTGTPPTWLSTVNQPAWVDLSVTEQLPAWAPLVAVVQVPALMAVHWFADLALTACFNARVSSERVPPPSRQENAKVCGCQVFRLPLLSWAVAVMVYESTPLAILVVPVRVMLTRDCPASMPAATNTAVTGLVPPTGVPSSVAVTL